MSVFNEESDMTRHIDGALDVVEVKELPLKRPTEQAYIPKAKPVIIKFNSRASTKIKDQYYTFEYGEERQIDNFDNIDMEKEKQALIDDCNAVVDDQIKVIVDMLIRNN